MAAFVATKSLSLAKKNVSTPSSALDFRSPALSLKSRLARGDFLHGLILFSLSPILAEIAGLSGYDYVIIDLEHGEGGLSEALACLRALGATSTPAIIRLPLACPVWAKKALDLGPAGVMIPNVESPAVAAAVVSYCRYPPRGVRGTAYQVVRASAYGIDNFYVSRCEDETLVICQVEKATAIAEVEAIASVEGVDVVMTGPNDLAASMGFLQDLENIKVRAKLREAEKKVLDASSGNMAYFGGFATTDDPPEQLKLRGYHMVVGAKDIGLFRQAALEQVKRFKKAAMLNGEENKNEQNGHGSGEEKKKKKEQNGHPSSYPILVVRSRI